MSNQVSNSEYETLSVLLDDEASELDIHRALKLTASDAAARDCLRRFQLVSSALRGEDLPPHRDISAVVSKAIEGEDSYHLSEHSRSWWLGRVAVAASVALAVVGGAQFWYGDSSAPGSSLVQGDEKTVEMDVPSAYQVPVPARVVGNSLPAQSVVVQPRLSQQELEQHLNLLLEQRAIEQRAMEQQRRDIIDGQTSYQAEMNQPSRQ